MVTKVTSYAYKFPVYGHFAVIDPTKAPAKPAEIPARLTPARDYLCKNYILWGMPPTAQLRLNRATRSQNAYNLWGILPGFNKIGRCGARRRARSRNSHSEALRSRRTAKPGTGPGLQSSLVVSTQWSRRLGQRAPGSKSAVRLAVLIQPLRPRAHHLTGVAERGAAASSLTSRRR